jgi:uncharacterized protein YcnI
MRWPAARLPPARRPSRQQVPTDKERMTMHHRKIAVLTVAGALAAPAAAQAHITLQPKTAVAGAYTVLDVRVPNERDKASTVKVDVRFPDGFAAVSYQPVPGRHATRGAQR